MAGSISNSKRLATRSVHFAGCTVNPTADWMKQVARNLTDCCDGFLGGIRYLLMDRDGKFCQEFRDLLEHEGVDPVRLPPRSPNLTPHIERFMRSIEEECLERMIFFGEKPFVMPSASTWPITTENEITKGWPIGSCCLAPKWAVRPVRSNVGSDWVAYCGTIIGKRPDRRSR